MVSEEAGCEICGKKGVSLLFAFHRELGSIWICNDCWKKEYHNIVDSGGSRGCTCG
jgi:ribosome-binding protein aMBF1 (putative translation factor)